MTNNINRIGINPNSVNLFQQQAKNTEAKTEEKELVKAEQNQQKSNLAPTDVLNYMANQAIMAKSQVSTQKVYDIGKYVNAEQAARIANLMSSFEAKVTEGLLQIENEPGLQNLSEATKYEIAANMVE